MNKTFTALAVVGATLAALPAFAQTAAPAAPAASTLRHGTAIPGLCVFSGELAVGKAVVHRFLA